MFSYSTQRKFWMFGGEEELTEMRFHVNKKYTEKMLHKDAEKDCTTFLTPNEEMLILKYYEYLLREFCRKFKPTMPRTVIATSFHYFKRFYLQNSTMDYHPKEILVTCVYLACKVEEFNISINQFVSNVRGERTKAMDIILNSELLLMDQLGYHLTTHNPFNPVEGFLIDLKTRFKELTDVEQLRPLIDDFLEQSFFTDACLLYAPSQIALAAVLHAATGLQINLDSYVTNTLLGEEMQDQLNNLIDSIRTIRRIVKSVDKLPRDRIKSLEKKLEQCRNPENNPDSELYRKRIQQFDEEDYVPDLPEKAENMNN